MSPGVRSGKDNRVWLARRKCWLRFHFLLLVNPNPLPTPPHTLAPTRRRVKQGRKKETYFEAQKGRPFRTAAATSLRSASIAATLAASFFARASSALAKEE